jgi:ribonucleoside-diphosphate reductase alpha chain
MDYIFRWLHLRFLTGQQQSLFANMQSPSPVVAGPCEDNGISASADSGTGNEGPGNMFHEGEAMKDLVDLGDAPSCSFCGAIMVRNGSCYKCLSCGSTSGCS